MTEPTDAAATPPPDPRAGAAGPALGELPVHAEVEPGVHRFLAPNPSPMTLDGTNTYLLTGGGRAVVIDPGPREPEHRARILAAIGAQDVEVTAVLVTHRHDDHAAGASSLAATLACPVRAADPRLDTTGVPLADGQRFEVGDRALSVVATPGHTTDHLAFRLDSGSLLSGDHVLGRGTSVVAHPDGDLAAYLRSLRRVLDLGPHALHPGHGPSCTDDPAAVVRYYLEHREFRRRQLLAAIDGSPRSLEELLERCYPDTPATLRAAARRSLAALIEMLVTDGSLRRDDAGRVDRSS